MPQVEWIFTIGKSCRKEHTSNSPQIQDSPINHHITLSAFVGYIYPKLIPRLSRDKRPWLSFSRECSKYSFREFPFCVPRSVPSPIKSSLKHPSILGKIEASRSSRCPWPDRKPFPPAARLRATSPAQHRQRWWRWRWRNRRAFGTSKGQREAGPFPRTWLSSLVAEEGWIQGILKEKDHVFLVLWKIIAMFPGKQWVDLRRTSTAICRVWRFSLSGRSKRKILGNTVLFWWVFSWHQYDWVENPLEDSWSAKHELSVMGCPVDLPVPIQLCNTPRQEDDCKGAVKSLQFFVAWCFPSKKY